VRTSMIRPEKFGVDDTTVNPVSAGPGALMRRRT
jgi:hypothetical protein